MRPTCCVVGCDYRGSHEFPADIDRMKAWVTAIKRAQNQQGDLWTPGPSSVVCVHHFKPSDYKTQTITGAPPLQKRLLETAVPSIFWWALKKAERRKKRVAERESKMRTILQRRPNTLGAFSMERVPDITIKDEPSDPENEGVVEKVIIDTKGKITHYCHGEKNNEPSESETDKESVVSTSTDRDADPDYIPDEMTGQRSARAGIKRDMQEQTLDSTTSDSEFEDSQSEDSQSEDASEESEEDCTNNVNKKKTLKRRKKMQEHRKKSSRKRKKQKNEEIKDEFENGMVMCPICTELITRQARHQHLLSHTPTPYQCQDCGEKFSELATFGSHIYTHKDRFFDPSFILWPDNNKQYKCPYLSCQKSLTTIDVEDHFINYHRPTMTMTKRRCPVCKARHIHSHGSHILKHLEWNTTKCQLCESFFTGKKMMEHLRFVHDVGKFGWQCRICADHQKYVSVSSLEKHLYTHMKKPFCCQACTAAFRYSADLEEHWYSMHSDALETASTQQNQILDNNEEQEGSHQTQELAIANITSLTTENDNHSLMRSKPQQRYRQQSVEKTEEKEPIIIAPLEEDSHSDNKDLNSYTSRNLSSSEVGGRKMIAKGSDLTQKPVQVRGTSNGENEENVLLLVKQVPMHCSKPGCVESFEGPVQYWAHFRSKHWRRVEGNQYLCMTCWQLFRHYGKHQCDYLNNNLIANTCPYCGQLFKSIQPWRNHTMVCRDAIEEKAIKCFKCATSHRNIDELCFHLVREHADGLEKFLYVCRRCGVSFRSCDHHLRCSRQSTWIGICTVCQKTVKVHERFDHAMACTGQKKPIACPSEFCNKSFSQALALYEHYRDIHWEEDGGFRWLCQKCGSMSCSELLDCCVSPSITYLCLYCGKRYITSDRIQLHSRTCLGCFPLDDVFFEDGGPQSSFTFYRRQLQCMFCDNKYDRLADIALHVFKEHCTFSPAPRCWFCIHQGRFPDGIQLWQHMMKHHLQWSLNQKYLCVCCGSSFTNLCLVNEHQVYTHGFLVPIRHICSCCGNLFDTKDEMKEHRINCLISTSTVTHSALNHSTYDPEIESEGSEEAEEDNVQIISSESSSNENEVFCEPPRHSKSISSIGKSPVTENLIEEFSSASFICPHYICERSYIDLEKMWKHYQDCHWEASNKQSYLCTLCGKPYTNAVMMTQHNRAAHAGKASSDNLCTFCGDRFDSSDGLDRHTTECSKSTNICPQCGKHLPDLNNLHLHIEHHKNDANETSTDEQSSEEKSDKESSSPALTKTWDSGSWCHSYNELSKVTRLPQQSKLAKKSWKVHCSCGKNQQGYLGREWISHLTHHHSGQNLRCAHCRKVFAGINNIKLHMKRMHKQLNYYMVIPVLSETRTSVRPPVEALPPVRVKPQSIQSRTNSSRVFKTNTIEHCTMCTKAFINLEMLHKHMANVHKNVSGKTAMRKSQLDSMCEKDQNVYVKKHPKLQNVRNNVSTLPPPAESITPKPVALVHNRAAEQSKRAGLPFTPPIVKSKVASDRVKDGKETKEDLISFTKYWSVESSGLVRKDQLVDGVKTVVIAPTYLPEEAELSGQPLSSKSSGTLQGSWLPGQPLMETSQGGRQEGSGLPAEVPSVVVVKPEPEDDSLQQALVTPTIASDQDFSIPQIMYKQAESSSQFQYEHGLNTPDTYGKDLSLFKQDLQCGNEADLNPPSFQCDQALPDPSSHYEQGLNTQHYGYGQSLSSPCSEYEEGLNTPHQVNEEEASSSRSSHNTQETRIGCSGCTQSFKSQRYLLIHQQNSGH